jgi:hypothetical protein
MLIPRQAAGAGLLAPGRGKTTRPRMAGENERSGR